jgi:hypothetical protein
MVDVLLVVAATSMLGMGPQGAGWLSASWGMGGVAGGTAAVTGYPASSAAGEEVVTARLKADADRRPGSVSEREP